MLMATLIAIRVFSTTSPERLCRTGPYQRHNPKNEKE